VVFRGENDLIKDLGIGVHRAFIYSTATAVVNFNCISTTGFHPALFTFKHYVLAICYSKFNKY
jgi:hypothetical protein